MLDYLRAYWHVTFGRVVKEERGQTAVEYGLVILLVALVLAGVVATGMTSDISSIVSKITSKVAAIP